MSIAELPSSSSEFERTPPHDMPAEQCVLGGMLLSKDAVSDVVEVLRPDDFYRPAHQVIFEAVIDLYARGEPADAVTIAAELTKRGALPRAGGAPYLHTLISSVPTAANAGYYAKIVRERAILRRLIEAGTRIVQLGYGSDGEIDDAVDRAQAEVYNVTENRTSEDYHPLSEVMPGALDELEAIGSRGGAMVGVPTGFADLDNLMNGLHPGQLVVVAARPAMGKALALDTPLPTPDGWTTMGSVQIGDYLLAADGTPTMVVNATDVMVNRPCYEVTMDDGAVIIADGQHQWLTDTRASRKSAQAAVAGYDRCKNQRIFASVKTTDEIFSTVRCDTKDRRLNHSIKNAAPLDLPDQELPLPPYLVGAWLGDGHTDAARITTADAEIIARLEAEGFILTCVGYMVYSIRLDFEGPFAERDCVVCGESFKPKNSYVRSCGRSCGGRARFVSNPVPASQCGDCGRPSSGGIRCQECTRNHGSVQATLRSTGLLGDKHIPLSYLRGSVDQRRQLLAGLLDTDGTVNSTGSVQFSVTQKRLADDFCQLVVSLGYRCSMSTKKVRGRTAESSTAYTVTFATSDEVFSLERKKIIHKERCTQRHERIYSRFIENVRPIASVPVRCVEVDHPDHLYLASESLIPTHNSTLGLDFARAAALKNDMTTVVFSLEMSRNEITMRLLSAEARVPLHTMRSGLMSDDDWTRLARRMSEVAEAPLFIDDSPNMSMMEIRAKCRRLKQRQDLKFVIIDYLQLMQAGKRTESRQVEVSEFSRSLKLLAKELDVPVIAVSQLNRGPEQRNDKKPMVSDLRESGSIEQDADVVILLHREDAYEKESPRAGEADLIVAKHRNGPTATVTVAFQGHYSRFVDMAPS